jgi:stalled ribosome alternative rescue factor ArfA
MAKRQNAVARDLRTAKYRIRVVKATKGKGSYDRKPRTKGRTMAEAAGAPFAFRDRSPASLAKCVDESF